MKAQALDEAQYTGISQQVVPRLESVLAWLAGAGASEVDVKAGPALSVVSGG